MSENEWGHGFEGKKSTGVITAPTGDRLSEAGEARDSGALHDRMGAVACWSAVMDESQHMVRKWIEVIAV